MPKVRIGSCREEQRARCRNETSKGAAADGGDSRVMLSLATSQNLLPSTRTPTILRGTLVLLLLILFGCGQDAPRPSAPPGNPQHHGVQPFLNEITKTVHDAVGAGVLDQIPGTCRGDDEVVLDAGGVECSDRIATVKEAASLLQAQLTAKFGGRLVTIEQMSFRPHGEIVLLATFKTQGWRVDVDIPIFKRTSKRVLIFPIYLAKKDAVTSRESEQGN